MRFIGKFVNAFKSKENSVYGRINFENEITFAESGHKRVFFTVATFMFLVYM